MQRTAGRHGVILGLTNEGVDTSAALLVDGRVQFAVAEERLIREKRTRRFPTNAIRACLRHAGLRPRHIDVVSVGRNPLRNTERHGGGQFDGMLNADLHTIAPVLWAAVLCCHSGAVSLRPHACATV